jgi:transcriptional regulator with XRE-family HTH domain
VGSNNIRYYRKKLGISQADIAKELGVSPNSVSKWETGKTMPDLKHAIRLSEILGTELGVLFARKLCS